MKLAEFIINFVDQHILNKPLKDIPSGHNGGYYDLHTQARLVSHAVILCAKCYDLTGKAAYQQKAKELTEYLIANFCPKKYAYHHLLTKGKDPSNGLIGQAWTIEALISAAQLTGNTGYTDAAAELFLQHKFDKNDGLWYILDISGRHYPKDMTFNHQLWLAACAALIKKPEVDAKVMVFLDKIDLNLTIYESGLINHSILHLRKNMTHRIGGVYKHIMLGSLFNRFTQKNLPVKHDFRTLCVGYHAFNTYAFAMLKEMYPDHAIWKNEKIIKAVKYLRSNEFTTEIETSPYGYAYNPPGFEVPYSLSVLDQITVPDAQNWVHKQIAKTYDSNTGYFDQNTKDKDTLSYRLYEATRLPDTYLNTIEL